MDDGREPVVDGRNRQRLHDLCVTHGPGIIGEHDQLAAPGTQFLSGSAKADGYAWGVDFNRGLSIPYHTSAFSGVRLVQPMPREPARNAGPDMP
jgi:hypothetical protein